MSIDRTLTDADRNSGYARIRRGQDYDYFRRASKKRFDSKNYYYCVWCKLKIEVGEPHLNVSKFGNGAPSEWAGRYHKACHLSQAQGLLE